jgi:hypothetical protein
MKIDFRGGSAYVRNELSFKVGQKVTTENGQEWFFRRSTKQGKIRWFHFQNKDGRWASFRMMCFPYLHAMGENIEMRDNIGPIDVRVSMVKHINRRLVNLLK